MILKSEKKTIFQLRRCLLNRLYDFFRQFPLAAIGLDQLSEDCRVEPAELNWNMVYLEKSGWVELSKSYDEPPFVAASAALTAKGIAFVESETGFDDHFPILEQTAEPEQNQS